MIPTVTSGLNTESFPSQGDARDETFDFMCRPVEAAGMTPPTALTVVGGSDERKRMFRTACKARGVAGDHNPNTAYLLVPENAPHGYLLHCSHTLCVRTGRQFRYCAYCCQPVAKRNFHTRHNHGLIQYQEGRPIIPADEIFLSNINKKFRLPHRPAHRSNNDDSRSLKRRLVRSVSSGSNSQLFEAHVSKKTKQEDNEEVHRTVQQPPSMIAVSDHETESVKSDLQCSQESLSSEEEAWIKLFHERPLSAMQGGSNLKKWLASMLKLTFPRQNLESAVLLFSQEDGILGDGVVEDLDSVLGDFDKDLKDYEGNWDLETI